MGRRRRRGGGHRVGLLLPLLAGLGLATYLLADAGNSPVLPPSPTPGPPPEATLRVHYVDVGQGDAVVWELPGGAVVLYDCGPPVDDAAGSPLVRYLQERLGRPAGSRLEALVASHGHLDHIGGCDAVFEVYDVARVYEPWYEGEDAPESYRRFQREVEAEGATLHRLPGIGPGTLLDIPAAATILWPRAFAPGGWDHVAEASLVVRLQHGSTTFCFQGDIEEAQERELTGRCDAYLVGHHGSRHASSAAWLARMRPASAVVSHGENPYGHPHPEALCRVQQAGATILATPGAPLGAIVLESDGRSLRVVSGQPDARYDCVP